MRQTAGGARAAKCMLALWRVRRRAAVTSMTSRPRHGRNVEGAWEAANRWIGKTEGGQGRCAARSPRSIIEQGNAESDSKRGRKWRFSAHLYHPPRNRCLPCLSRWCGRCRNSRVYSFARANLWEVAQTSACAVLVYGGLKSATCKPGTRSLAFDTRS